MRLSMILPAVFLVALVGTGAQQSPEGPQPSAAQGVRLEDISWPEAEQRLKADAVVALPLGAGALQHGPHLKLGNDSTLAEYLTRRLLDASNVVVAPALPYHYFPALQEYPGSTTLSMTTARDLTADVARSLARHGPRRFYVLNTGESTVPALAESAKLLASEGILLRYTDVRARLETTIRSIQRQVVGSHADEIETSMMLYIDPASVEMRLAAREYAPPSTPFRLTRREGGPGTHSPTGAWGDPRLATREKGRELVEALVSAIRADIEDLRRAPLPTGSSTATQTRPVARPGGPPDRFRRGPDECLPGDDRAIRALGPTFYIAWMHQSAQNLSELWQAEGDMVHPDGFIEGSAQVIRQNRSALFMRPEYKHSRHSLAIGQIRCITGEVAIADAKWDLRGLTDAKGQTVPPVDGLCTLVLKKGTDGWRIEAYRYSTNPQNPSPPTLLPRPGAPEAYR